MKKPILYSAAVIIAGIILALILIPAVNAQTGNTQDYNENRFAVIAAGINVLSPQMSSRTYIQNVMLKIDTVSGRAWLLQVEVAGGNEPRIRNARWHEIDVMHREK